MTREEYQPGTHAPETGHYEELNVGERLPRAPRGFTWRHLEDEGC
jgi:hypothetical protein